jgi:hypothetical protein
MNYFVNGCIGISELHFTGNPANVTSRSNCFAGLTPGGIMYYDYNYDYSNLIPSLPEGWTAVPDLENIEVTSLIIEAEDISGTDEYTTINYVAVIKGTIPGTEELVENVTLAGQGISDYIGDNPSKEESREVEISFTFLGATATTTITQAARKGGSYTVNLNNQWRTSSVTNPNTSMYEGVYESHSNYNSNNSGASMYITIKDLETFQLYIRSYAESNYDYVMVSQLDQDITYSTSYSNTALIKAHTRGIQNSGTAISSYQLVEFTNIPAGEHTIEIIYRKDSSQHSGNDRGYVLIPKDQGGVLSLYDFTEVEYLQSTGTQWIDTGVAGANGVETKFQYMTSSISGADDTSIFGARDGNVNRFGLIVFYTSGYKFHAMPNGINRTADLNAHVFEHGSNCDWKVRYDGVDFAQDTSFTGAPSYNTYIFAERETSTTGSRKSTARVYYFKLYKNGALVRHMIPILDNNGTPCFFDKVSRTLFYNKGTGNFKYGLLEPVETPEMTELEYIESTGTQYINTGYNPNGYMKYEFQITNSSTTGCIFGAYNSSWTNGNGYYTNIVANSSQNNWFHYYSNTDTGVASSANETVTINRGSIQINGATATGVSNTTFNITYPTYIFGGNTTGKITQPTSFRLHYFKMYDNGVLVRDFIPALDAKNKPCLYDKITGLFFYNQGGGEFLYTLPTPEEPTEPEVTE